MKRKLLKAVLLTTLPVMAGYIAIGIGFGILLKVNGYGLWWAVGMSVFIYAGAMQYVGVSLLSGGARKWILNKLFGQLLLWLPSRLLCVFSPSWCSTEAKRLPTFLFLARTFPMRLWECW